MAEIPKKQLRTQESEREGRIQELPDLRKPEGELSLKEEGQLGQALWRSVG